PVQPAWRRIAQDRMQISAFNLKRIKMPVLEPVELAQIPTIIVARIAVVESQLAIFCRRSKWQDFNRRGLRIQTGVAFQHWKHIRIWLHCEYPSIRPDCQRIEHACIARLRTDIED